MPTLELKPTHEPVQHDYTALRQHPVTATAAMHCSSRIADLRWLAPIFLALLGFYSLPLEPACRAATYCVDGNSPFASDRNPGTETLPWKTISRATPLLEPGDALRIKAGTYRETVVLTQSGTAANSITIMAYPGHGETRLVGLTLNGRVGRPILFGVGYKRERRAIHDPDRTAFQEVQRRDQSVATLCGGGQGFGELGQGQAGFGAAVGAVLLREVGAALQFKERLELAHHFTAGGLGIEVLPERTPERPPASVVAVSAIGLLAGLGKEVLE